VRNERKYKILTLFAVLLSVLLFGNCFREYFRMEAAVERQHTEYVLKGAKTYAENCAQCHGPRGEGVIGMPLNRKVFQVDYQSPAGKQVYDMLTQTLRQGRKGNDQHFEWRKTPDGHFISYTTMPAWHKDFGGPLDDDYIKALVLFIMNPDGSQWDLVGDPEVAPFQPADLSKDEKTGEIPLPDSNVDAATNAAAKALLRNVQKSQCLSCHTIGTRGGKIGPDLSHVGSWGIDQTFLENWIKYANVPQPKDADQTPAMPHDQRMPVYWSANRATASPELNLKDKVVSEGPYFMPRFKGKLTDEEISILAKYLLGLK
jgi:mono/diheme cytochrome c family protein